MLSINFTKKMKGVVVLLAVMSSLQINAQLLHKYSQQDSLRGSITPEREWWDLLHYDLHVEVNIKDKSIDGSNTILFKSIKEYQVMQIDLQEPLMIKTVSFHGNELKWESNGKAHFIYFNAPIPAGIMDSLTISYSGKPQTAKYPPWDGGFSWSKDQNGNPFVTTCNQGIGASLWWPCKDHGYDEPEQGITMHITVPQELMVVCNGRLISNVKNKKDRTFTWNVVNPINNYGVNINIADYVHIHDTLNGKKGVLDLDYYVLSYNEERARNHFQQAKMMLRAFEYWFGPYPFYEDSYKLVEAPYLGMEHQSSITYGNGYENGYMGRDRGNTGYMDKFDYIIIHESGHEWFANNITCKDNADMWIHESFTTYSEALFVEYYYGKEAGQHYIRQQRAEITNRKAMIADYDVNADPTLDIYYKGSSMINTIRTINNNDEKWHNMLLGLNQDFYHSTVSTKEIEDYISTFLGIDLRAFFDQYLRSPKIPSLEIDIRDDHTLHFKWANCNDDFSIPIRLQVNDKEFTWDGKGDPEGELKTEKKISKISLDKNYYVYYKFDKSNPIFNYQQVD